MNKKILLSLFLVLLIAVSVSAVSAEEATEVVATDETVDEVSLPSDDADVIASTIKPGTNSADAIQKAITCSTEGDTVDLSDHASYDVGNATIEVGVNNLIIKGNGNTEIKGWGGPGNGLPGEGPWKYAHKNRPPSG